MKVKDQTQLAKTETPHDFLQKILLPLEEKERMDVEIFDSVAYRRLPDRRLAKIRLSIETGRGAGSIGNYRSLLVHIVSKDTGPIDSQLFPFDTTMRFVKRVDDRSDFDGRFEVINHVSWDWYIAIPETTAPLCAKIARYIELFI